MQPDPDAFHVPVLVDKVNSLLALQPGQTALDATTGGGGHTAHLLAATAPDGRVVGLDRDADALAAARERLSDPRLTLVQSNFDRVDEVLEELGLCDADALLADLGVSSHQLDEGARGFAFSQDGPLDMRMDPSAGGSTAADLVARLSQDELAAVFAEFGEEPRARAAARAVVRARHEAPIRTTRRLAEVLARSLGRGSGRSRRHPATLCFQALRIAVNRELAALERLLEMIPRVLRPGGRLVVISYHSLEDRRVKQAMRWLAGACRCPPRMPECRCGATALGRVLTPRVVKPGREEVARNPRARSARLRAFERAA